MYNAWNGLSHTTAPKHKEQSGLTMTTARPVKSADNGYAISRTLTPLEEYDMRTFGKILEEKEFVINGTYFSFYTDISVTRRN